MSYGTVETGQIAQQYTGDNHLVYKVFDDICDVKNNNSNLVITKFNYKVMPLVNYMVDDYCEVIKTQSGIFLRNLVGKKHKTDNTNIIQLDKRINMANKMVNNNIINLY
jgi:phenylacetate-coenzyme A ligase PaaK-like adenylate-forming protein